MEIKAQLNKPCTEEERNNFVAYYCQNCQGVFDECYELRETENSLQAWGYTEEEITEREKERISHLRCTKRVLALILEQLGILYSQLKSLIDSNERAQLEWDLCVELERSNPLIDIIGAELGLSSVDIDNIFRYANGEIPSIEREVVNE